MRLIELPSRFIALQEVLLLHRASTIIVSFEQVLASIFQVLSVILDTSYNEI